MAAKLSERLFSLELLVDWVCLEPGLLLPPVVALEEQEEEEEAEAEEASPPQRLRGLCPAVAFRLLDFPTLLVYPPGGPAAPAPELRPGLVSFGRGKSCLFRLHPATLQRLLLQMPLYTLLLQLLRGRPTPAPKLLGACSISLAAAADRVLGPAASGCSQGHRGNFPLHNQEGERIGDIALGYRLTDLGSSLLGHPERPVTSMRGGVAVEVSSQTLQGKQQPKQLNSEKRPGDADKPLVDVNISTAQKDLKDHSKAKCGNTGSVENGKTNSLFCSNASSERNVSPPDQEELDMETNIICPPPLYYTHLTQEKVPLKQGKITVKPQRNAPEELDGAFPEEKLVNPPAHTDPSEHINSATQERPPVLINLPHVQDIGASNQTTYPPQSEQSRINTIRQLPLLNALLVELSLLYSQPTASPTHIHPHLAWLYRTEDKRSPESPAKSTRKSESKKDELSVGEKEKSVSLQYRRSQTENLKKGKHFEKKGGALPKRVPRRKLLYGLTNTLKLRLKQTNPGMLAVHEKREQYRKTQAQMLDEKLRIPSSKVKVLSFAEKHQLPKGNYLESGASFAENSGTSKQISVVLDHPSTTQETQLKCATEKTVDCGENRTSDDLLEEVVSSPNSIISEKFVHANILKGKVEVKVHSLGVFQDVALVDRTIVGKEIGDKQVGTTDNDIPTADASMRENNPSKSSCCESISEMKYSDDFTSPCCSEDSNRILQVHGYSPGTEYPKHSQHTSKSSETRLSMRKNSSEQSSILSPPFSAGSPFLSYKRFHIAKTEDKSLEEASHISTSDFSSSLWTEERESQTVMHKVIKRDQGSSAKLKTRTCCKSSEKSRSPRTSQVSSYLPSNLSELELNVVDSSTSDHSEEDSDDIGPLNISKQCKDICELVINKLPGYTV